MYPSVLPAQGPSEAELSLLCNQNGAVGKEGRKKGKVYAGKRGAQAALPCLAFSTGPTAASSTDEVL